MGQLKQHYHDQLARVDEELWDRLEQEWLMQQHAYQYEDNPNPNDKDQAPNNVRQPQEDNNAP